MSRFGGVILAGVVLAAVLGLYGDRLLEGLRALYPMPKAQQKVVLVVPDTPADTSPGPPPVRQDDAPPQNDPAPQDDGWSNAGHGKLGTAGPPPPTLAVHRPGAPPPAYSALSAEMRRVSPGRVVYNPPASMRMGVAEEITIRIARDDVQRDLTQRLIGQGQPVSEAIEVGDFMRVRLDGRTAFAISPAADQDRAIPPGGIGEWLFQVTPLEAGRQVLYLHVFIRLKAFGSDELVSQPVLHRKIEVKVNYWWDIQRLWRENWQWWLTGLGTAIAVIASYPLKRWWKRRDGRRR